MYTRRELAISLAGPAISATIAYEYARHRRHATDQSGLTKPPRMSTAQLALLTRTGERTHLAAQPLASEGALLYVFRVSCDWCSRNRLSINSAATQLQERRACYGLLVDDDWPAPEAYVFPVFRVERIRESGLKVSGTPPTFAVDKLYQVSARFGGAFTGAVRLSVVRALDIDLAEL
jgi:hypothetical protein